MSNEKKADWIARNSRIGARAQDVNETLYADLTPEQQECRDALLKDLEKMGPGIGNGVLAQYIRDNTGDTKPVVVVTSHESSRAALQAAENLRRWNAMYGDSPLTIIAAPDPHLPPPGYEDMTIIDDFVMGDNIPDMPLRMPVGTGNPFSHRRIPLDLTEIKHPYEAEPTEEEAAPEPKLPYHKPVKADTPPSGLLMGLFGRVGLKKEEPASTMFDLSPNRKKDV
jgi:hypothetical protein